MGNIRIHKGENLQENNFRGVYLIRNLDNGLLKIGRCNNLARRFKEIVRSFNFCGVEPRLEVECFLGYNNEVDLELYLHEQFKEVREQNEWFGINDVNIVLEKLSDFEEIEKLKEEKKNKKVVVKPKNKIEKAKKIPEELDEYCYFKFLEFIYNSERKIIKIEKIFWKTKILNISELEKKVSSIMGTNYDIRDFTVFYDYDLIKQKIKPSRSILKTFEKLNTDCVVEIYNINEWEEEIEDEYGDIEVMKHREDILEGTFDFYTYLYEKKVKGFYESIVYYQKEMSMSPIMSLDIEKIFCELSQENLLNFLRKECNKYYKMYSVFKNPDIKYFED